eukprot:SAG25_NODE_12406_length_280_cov_1.132597_1_plen_40_part_10
MMLDCWLTWEVLRHPAGPWRCLTGVGQHLQWPEVLGCAVL